MLLVIRLLILSFMLVAGLVTHAAASSASVSSADSRMFLQMALTANSPASSYYTTSGHDPISPPDGGAGTAEVPVTESGVADDQRHQSPPARPEAANPTGIILTSLHDASSQEGWTPVRPTTTVLTLNHNPAVYGDWVTFTATVTPPSATGTVEFLLDGAPFGPPVAVMDGAAITPGASDLSPGVHIVSADYGGDETHGMSSSSLQKLSISKARQKIEFIPIPAVLPGGAAPVLSATATSGLPVGFVSSNPAVAVFTGVDLTIVGAGSTVITATQDGGDFFYPAVPVSRILEVKALQ